MSSVPCTLWLFYRGLIEKLKNEGIEPQICSSPERELDSFRKELGLQVYPAQILRQISPLRDILTIIKLIKIFRRNRYAIVHAHTPKAGILGMIAARLSFVQHRLYTCHGLPLETESGFKKRLLIWVEKLTCLLAEKVIVVSRSLSKKICDYNICPEKKMIILGEGTACGVDLKRFAPGTELIEMGRAIQTKYGIPNDSIVIGFIGRLVPDKGIHILTESFTSLYKKYPQTRLIIIGDFEPHRGKLPGETIEIINNHPGITRVKYTDKIEVYYAAMNMLVLPTRREGFPYALLEAGAMSLPVIATKVTGCVDAVEDGKNGLLVEPDNSEQLYEAMLKLITEPDMRKTFGKQGRKRAEDLFDSGLLINEHIKFYKQLLGENSCSGTG